VGNLEVLLLTAIAVVAITAIIVVIGAVKVNFLGLNSPWRRKLVICVAMGA
jgi:hypothetical protein